MKIEVNQGELSGMLLSVIEDKLALIAAKQTIARQRMVILQLSLALNEAAIIMQNDDSHHAELHQILEEMQEDNLRLRDQVDTLEKQNYYLRQQQSEAKTVPNMDGVQTQQVAKGQGRPTIHLGTAVEPDSNSQGVDPELELEASGIIPGVPNIPITYAADDAVG